MGVLLFDVEGIKIAMPCAKGSYDIVFVSLFNQKNQVGRKSLFQGALDFDNRVSASWNNAVMCVMLSFIPCVCLSSLPQPQELG